MPSLHARIDTLPPHAQPYPPRVREALRVLLVEDSRSDAALTELALDAAAISYTLQVLRKGSDVLPYLKKQGKYAAAARPDVLILDLGLPGSDGFEILADLAQLPAPMRDLPIVIVTGYEHFEYIRHSYPLWIPAYLTKPFTEERIREAFAAIGRCPATARRTLKA